MWSLNVGLKLIPASGLKFSGNRQPKKRLTMCLICSSVMWLSFWLRRASVRWDLAFVPDQAPLFHVELNDRHRLHHRECVALEPRGKARSFFVCTRLRLVHVLIAAREKLVAIA